MPSLESDKFSDALVEQYADLAHAAWSGWMQYLFSKCPAVPPGAAVAIPAELVSRWQRQIETPYAELSEQEKESDREEARKYLRVAFPAIVEAMTDAFSDHDHPEQPPEDGRYAVVRRAVEPGNTHYVVDYETAITVNDDTPTLYAFLQVHADYNSAVASALLLNSQPIKEKVND